MAEKSLAILLNRTQYGDKSLIINLLTKNKGLISCFVHNAFGKNRRLDRIQLLTGLEVVYTLHEGREMAQLREMVVANARAGIFASVYKTSVAFYMAELLSRVVRERLQPDARLYTMLEDYLQHLEKGDIPEGEVPVCFTFDLIDAMGIRPVIDTGEPRFFNLVEGVIGPEAFGLHYAGGDELTLVTTWYNTRSFGRRLLKRERQVVFNVLLAYLDHQLGEPLHLKSPAVLQELLN